MPHVKGRWASRGETIKLQPWQQWSMANAFGWWVVDEDASTGWSRRFRTVYITVARKSGKTSWVAPVGLYAGFAEGEAGAEVYSGATTRDQARIAFDIANQMVRKSKGFREQYGVESQAHNIYSAATASKFEPLSADVKALDGKNPHFAIVDEYHAHLNDGVFAALETGMGARENPLMWVITTAGSNLGGPCYRMNEYAQKVLDGVVDDESFFAAIYTIDQPDALDDESGGDDWTDPACWQKANPNLGVSVFQRDIERLCAQAQADPVKQSAFLTKRLNVWVAADLAWMNMGEWNACGKPFDVADFKGADCYVGLDLATRSDVAAVAILFEKDGHVYYQGRYFLPRDVVREASAGTHQKYAGWAAAGLFDLTPGNIIDFTEIERVLLELSSVFTVKEIAYDPWQATQLALSLQGNGAKVIEVKPTVANFTEPMKDLGALVKERKFHHGGDPVLGWMASNVVAHYDKKDNIYPTKERNENKIDGIVATIMALGRLQRHQNTTSRYEDPDAEVVVV